MTLEQVLERVRARLGGAGYGNEAAVSQGVALPILSALGWDDRHRRGRAGVRQRTRPGRLRPVQARTTAGGVIRAACDVMGVTFGTDLQIELPNG